MGRKGSDDGAPRLREDRETAKTAKLFCLRKKVAAVGTVTA